MKRENCVLIIAGPSGTGKTAIATAIVDKYPEYTFLRSATTRAKRGDAHDDEYLYYTVEEFERACENGEMAEHMVYGGNMYGTPNSELDRAFREGKTPVLVLDLNGCRSLDLHPKYSACNVYLYASPSVIDERLRSRYFIYGVTPEGERLYNVRRQQNLNDWLGIAEYGEHLYAFISNEGTIDECTECVLSTFRDFIEGEERDEWKNHAIINGFASCAREMEAASGTKL